MFSHRSSVGPNVKKTSVQNPHGTSVCCHDETNWPPHPSFRRCVQFTNFQEVKNSPTQIVCCSWYLQLRSAVVLHSEKDEKQKTLCFVFAKILGLPNLQQCFFWSLKKIINRDKLHPSDSNSLYSSYISSSWLFRIESSASPNWTLRRLWVVDPCPSGTHQMAPLFAPGCDGYGHPTTNIQWIVGCTPTNEPLWEIPI